MCSSQPYYRHPSTSCNRLIRPRQRSRRGQPPAQTITVWPRVERPQTCRVPRHANSKVCRFPLPTLARNTSSISTVRRCDSLTSSCLPVLSPLGPLCWRKAAAGWCYSRPPRRWPRATRPLRTETEAVTARGREGRWKYGSRMDKLLRSSSRKLGPQTGSCGPGVTSTRLAALVLPDGRTPVA